jgi:hypothetical protein
MGKLRVLAAVLLAACLAGCGDEEEGSADTPGTPPPSWVPLSETAFSVEWGVPGVPSVVPAGSAFAVGVRVKNTGDQAWLDPRTSDAKTYAAGAVRLSYRWWKASNSGKPHSDYGPERGELLGPVQPGQTTVMAIEVNAPAEPGDYKLQLDLLQELVSWFEPHGAQKLLVPVKVGSPTAAPAAATGAR